MKCYCGKPRTSDMHSRHNPDGHKFGDPRPTGIQTISDGRLEYQKSEIHREAYKDVTPTADCVFEAAGAPGECIKPITPHHLFPVGRAGSRERAERVAPVAPACRYHNDWASQEGIEWAQNHFVTIGGRDWPLLMTEPLARGLEETGREFKPASSLSALPHQDTK